MATEEPPAKRARLEGEDDTAQAASTLDDEFDDLLGEGALGEAPQESAEETARRNFTDRLMNAGGRVEDENAIPELISEINEKAPSWGDIAYWRSAALLLACVGRSSRGCRTAFVTDGLPLLGNVLKEAVSKLEEGDAKERQEAGMWALAVLASLRALPLGRATLWEHRQSVGKPFDRLHRWCGKERSALAAELRAPTLALCKKWRQQPKPAGQTGTPEQKALRAQVLKMIAQGLQGIAGASPASPAPMMPMSPAHLPVPTAAAEVEAALFGHFKGATAEYRQHARMLRSNLASAGNAELRNRVLSGDLSAEDLVSMDSNQLAPEALQQARKDAELKVMRESVIEELKPVLDDTSPKHRDHNPNTAPPLMTSPSKEAEKEDEEARKTEGAASSTGAPPASMLPPPTPFREGGDFGMPPPTSSREAEPPTPEVMATPAPEDEDEDEAALLRWLSSAP